MLHEMVNLFNPILPGGALSSRVFGDKLSLLDGFTYRTETFCLFLNIEKQNFEQILNSNF